MSVCYGYQLRRSLTVVRVNRRKDEVRELIAIQLQDGFTFGDDAFGNHVCGNLHGGRGRSPSGLRLENVKHIILDGELHSLRHKKQVGAA